jgi:hypothetical protein
MPTNSKKTTDLWKGISGIEIKSQAASGNNTIARPSNL